MHTLLADYQDLLSENTRAFLYFGTVMSNGSPQVTPVWFDYEGEYFRVNTAKGRTKDRNIRKNPHVALLIADPNDPYRFLQVFGEVVEITEVGAEDHINSLSLKYRGKPWSKNVNEIRLIYKIRADKIVSR